MTIASKNVLQAFLRERGRTPQRGTGHGGGNTKNRSVQNGTVPKEGGKKNEANRQTVYVYVSNVFLPGDEDDRGSGSFVVSPCVLTVISDRRSQVPGS